LCLSRQHCIKIDNILARSVMFWSELMSNQDDKQIDFNNSKSIKIRSSSIIKTTDSVKDYSSSSKDIMSESTKGSQKGRKFSKVSMVEGRNVNFIKNPPEINIGFIENQIKDIDPHLDKVLLIYYCL
jgi:hypothetical protein